MIVECDKCQTRFNVGPERIRDEGSKVRCSNCKHVFMIYKPAPEESAPVAPDSPAVGEPAPDPAPDAAVDAEAPSDEDGEGESAAPEEKETGDPDDDLGLGDDLGLDDIPADAGLDEPSPGAADDLIFDDLGDDLEPGDDLGLDEIPEEPGLGDAASLVPWSDDQEDDLEPDDDLNLGDVPVDDLGGLDEDAEVAAVLGGSESGLGLGDDPDGDDAELFSAEDDLGPVDDLDVDTGAASVDMGLEERTPDEEPAYDFGDEDKDAAPLDYGDGDTDEDDEDHYLDEDEAEMVAGEFTTQPVRRSRGVLWGLIVILFIVAAGGGVYFFKPELAAPVVGKVMNLIGMGGEAVEEHKDDTQGNKKISPLNAKHFFRQNETAGQILVITGVAKSHYAQARHFISMKGLLHDAKGAILAQRMVFCGNVLSEEQLKTLTVPEMNKILAVKGGQNGTNMNVKPGQSVPFMLVFDKIPKELAEYTVEAFGSEPASPPKDQK